MRLVSESDDGGESFFYRWGLDASRHCFDYPVRDHSVAHGVTGFASFERDVKEHCLYIAVVEAGHSYVCATLTNGEVGRIDER